MINVDGIQLTGYLAQPPASAGAGAPTRSRHGVVLCHGFPGQRRSSGSFGETYPELANRLTTETGWPVLTFNFRGTGGSEGEFSLGGWLADLHAAVSYMGSQPDIDGVWLAGFGTGGSLALCAAGEDASIRGVAAFGAPADFGDWAENPRQCYELACETGAIHSKDYPPDFGAWARELGEIRAAGLIGKIPPRPLLVVHGSEDDVVSVADARALAEAAENQLELRIVGGAGHDLRHDPRAIAVLQGWLDRQSV